MKNFKLLAALLITILFLNFKSSAQAPATPTTSDLLVVRVYEASALALRSYMVISYGGGKIEEVPLDMLGLNTKGTKTNVDAINTVLDKIFKDGYSLLSSTGGSPGSLLITTYIFTKKQ